jgi:uncharacterized ferritin-like protein (DUF455 family)
MPCLRAIVLPPLLQKDAATKAASTLALDISVAVGANENIPEVAGIPGRPAKPLLVHAKSIQLLSLRTPEGRAALIHSIAHIELNAIDLALDIVWRFPGMPDDFYRNWATIAQEEAKHFTLLRNHLLHLGFDYGDFDAHNTLWDMAERTKGDLLARIALVPRTLEARGLDASPAVKKKLVGAGDHEAGKILDTILHDEIGHVAAGNRWYRYLCAKRGLDPISTYAELVQRYDAPKLKAPFNLPARRLAGFEEAELLALQDRIS